MKFQKIRGDIALHNFASRILQTIVYAHYTVVVSALRHGINRQLQNVPISKVKQCYEPTKFPNRSQKSTQLSKCVLSTKNHIFQRFCPNQVCQLVLCEHAKSSNRLVVVRSWTHGCTKTDTGPLTFGSLVEICVACYYSNHLIYIKKRLLC